MSLARTPPNKALQLTWRRLVGMRAGQPSAGRSGVVTRPPSGRGIMVRGARQLSAKPLGGVKSEMKRTTYLRLAAFLPLLPLVFLPLLRFFADADNVIRGALGGVLGVLATSVVVGGIPYVVAASLSLYLLRAKPPEAYWRLARWAPLIFVPIFGASLVVSGLLGAVDDLTDLWAIPMISAIYAVYVLPVGYFYVLIAWLGYLWLGRKGLLANAA